MTTPSAAGNKIPKGYAAGSLQQFTPEQMGLFQSLFGRVGPDSQLSKLASGDEAAFAPIEQQAQRDFQGFQGQQASRFSELAPGAMSARKGSGFKIGAGQASQDFASQLASQRMGIQRQALSDLMGISGTLLGQRPQENFLTPKKKPFWQELLTGLAPGVGQGVGTAGTLAGVAKLGLLA